MQSDGGIVRNGVRIRSYCMRIEAVIADGSARAKSIRSAGGSRSRSRRRKTVRGWCVSRAAEIHRAGVSVECGQCAVERPGLSREHCQRSVRDNVGVIRCDGERIFPDATPVSRNAQLFSTVKTEHAEVGDRDIGEIA